MHRYDTFEVYDTGKGESSFFVINVNITLHVCVEIFLMMAIMAETRGIILEKEWIFFAVNEFLCLIVIVYKLSNFDGTTKCTRLRL
jgi:hypothetical protein